jgi:hypothetical protein
MVPHLLAFPPVESLSDNESRSASIPALRERLRARESVRHELQMFLDQPVGPEWSNSAEACREAVQGPSRGRAAVCVNWFGITVRGKTG